MKKLAAAVVATALTALALSMPAGAAPPATLAAPAASITFLRAGGGSTSLGLLDQPLYAQSPAYVVVRRTTATAALEQYAAGHNFPAVTASRARGATQGVECYRDVHIVGNAGFTSNVSFGGLAYRGLLLQYAGNSFHPGSFSAAACARTPSPEPVVARTRSAGGSATLTFDCLAKSCKAKFAVFGQPSSCAHPIAVLPSTPGCLPSTTGTFTFPGGVSGATTVPLKGRPLSHLLLAVVLGGRRVILSRLNRLAQTQPLPAKPRAAALGAGCPAVAFVGSTATIQGRLQPSGAGTLHIDITGPGSAGAATAPIAADGSYTARITPDAVGTWTAAVTFFGDRSRHPATAGCSIKVLAQRQV